MTSPVADPAVSVVLPTYRRPDVLRSTLTSLMTLDYPPDRYEIVVVDDGSGDNTPDVMAELQQNADTKLVYLQRPNRGAAAARNQGARSATGDILIFLDDDIEVEPSHIRDHLAARSNNPDALINGHWEFPETLTQTLSASPFGRFRLEVEEWVKDRIEKRPLDNGYEAPSAVTACNLSIRRRHFWELGGFDETFPFAGYEDQELSYRAVQGGFPLIYDRRIRLVHNDQRLTLLEFCQRQRRGACSAVHLAKRHPEGFGGGAMMVENGPLALSDSPRIFLKKLLKRGLTTPPALAGVHHGVGLLERIAPKSRLLRRIYWFVCGLYIFLGVRDGFISTGSPPPAPVRVKA
jgi:GT2 family glycosyltransferase